MTVANPSFNASEFELRDVTNKYLSPDQTEQVSLTESRVNGQLDFLAQMLGWSGSNYWTNLPATVSQKRQLLGGSYGVYNNFILPRVIAVKTWENIEDFISPRVAIVEIERDDRIQAGQTAYLGIYAYPILSLTETAAEMVLNFGEVDDTFFTEINNNTQLKIDIPSARPAPFYRPEIGVAGDNAFHCVDNGGTLTLFPSYDTTGLFPYLFPILFAGSTYAFDKPLYLSYSNTLSVDVSPTYNEDTGRWVLSIPGSLGENSPGVTAILVWAYSDNVTPINSTLQVQIQNWRDPSDWNTSKILENFLGAWGNKGGFLPFYLAFDSLSLHGFDENKSLYLPVIERELAFNDVVDLVYAQRATIDSGIPGQLPTGKLWWNTTSGVLAIQVEQEETCPVWVEVDYREAPEQELLPEIIFPDVATFVAGQNSVPPSTISVIIMDITGLSSVHNVLNIEEPFSGLGRVYLYRQPDTQYWVPIRFEFYNVAAFEAASGSIPYGVPTYILNSYGLDPVGVNYSIDNLEITVSGAYKTVLVKENGPTEWTLFPDSILKFIANSSLFGGPVEGELWWDFDNLDPENRAAALYYDSSWVAINQNTPIAPPPSTLDMSTVLFYCDGNLLTNGVGFLTDDYEFLYTSTPAEGLYTVTYRHRSLTGRTNFPKIEISDSLTSSYQLDISSMVFSGVTYRMSPNVYDAETTLRLWASQHLQTANTTELLERDIYPNPLVADLNNGPALDNWRRFFVRMPLDYGRNGSVWQKTALICEDFAYYGSNIEPEKMDCPPDSSLPQIYEEVVLNNDRTDYTYVYTEPFLYSTVVYDDFSSVDASYTNGAVRPTVDVDYDEFSEAQFIDYDPLHNRLVDFSAEGFGNWQGVYLNINACGFLSGYYVNDVLDAAVEPIEAPIWDASIYKCPPTCDNPSKTYSVDSNNYKICYAYFVADAGAAEDGFFDPQEEASWRVPVTQPKTLYILPDYPVKPKEPFTVTVDLILDPTFNVEVSPSTGPEGSVFVLTVTTTEVANGTIIPFTVTGSNRLITTSGNVTISGNSGSATILTQVYPGANEDIATATLLGVATGQPNTSDDFTITGVPVPTAKLLVIGSPYSCLEIPDPTAVEDNPDSDIYGVQNVIYSPNVATFGPAVPGFIVKGGGYVNRDEAVGNNTGDSYVDIRVYDLDGNFLRKNSYRGFSSNIYLYSFEAARQALRLSDNRILSYLDYDFYFGSGCHFSVCDLDGTNASTLAFSGALEIVNDMALGAISGSVYMVRESYQPMSVYKLSSSLNPEWGYSYGPGPGVNQFEAFYICSIDVSGVETLFMGGWLIDSTVPNYYESFRLALLTVNENGVVTNAWKYQNTSSWLTDVSIYDQPDFAITSLVEDPLNNSLLVTGWCPCPALDPGQYNNGESSFIARIDPSTGNVISAKTIGFKVEYYYGILRWLNHTVIADDEGYIYTSFTPLFSPESGLLPTLDETYLCIICKFDSSLNFLGALSIVPSQYGGLVSGALEATEDKLLIPLFMYEGPWAGEQFYNQDGGVLIIDKSDIVSDNPVGAYWKEGVPGGPGFYINRLTTADVEMLDLTLTKTNFTPTTTALPWSSGTSTITPSVKEPTEVVLTLAPVIPGTYNFTATWRYDSSLTTFSVVIPE